MVMMVGPLVRHDRGIAPRPGHGQARSGVSLNRMFPGHVLQPEPALKQKNARSRLRASASALASEISSHAGPVGEITGRKEPRGKLPLPPPPPRSR